VVTGEPGGGGRSINGEKDGNTGGNKNGSIKGEVKGSTGEETDKKLLFKEEKEFIILLFLGRLRPRPLSPRLRSAVLPIKVIKSKKKLINNKIKMRGNAKRVQPKYADKIKCQNNIKKKIVLKKKSYKLNLKSK